MEPPRAQLRAYSEFDQILSDLLKNSERYVGGAGFRMKIDHASLEVVEKIDKLLQRDQYLFDQETKDVWRGAKTKIFSVVNDAQDIDVDLADMLQTHVRNKIEELQKTLDSK
jgi:hypothetical protein